MHFSENRVERLKSMFRLSKLSKPRETEATRRRGIPLGVNQVQQLDPCRSDQTDQVRNFSEDQRIRTRLAALSGQLSLVAFCRGFNR